MWGEEMNHYPKPLTTYEGLFRLRSALFLFMAEMLRAMPLRPLQRLGDRVAVLSVQDYIVADELRYEALDRPRQG